MKIQLTVVGKTFQDFVRKGVDEYSARLKHYLPFEIEIIPDIKNAKNFSFDQIKEKEGELILKSFQPGDCIVLLDERGLTFTSPGFAKYIEKKMQSVSKRLVFVIGGPYGFSQKVYEVASEKIALSEMTFSHQLVRLVFAEQLYRAMTIIANEPYHHE
ncbi:MAG: 23S rRNA (pseudouridine(1915)-N(3))-methyltransferase RlmH [Dysgonamonadaceae bacterium]|jgi:23S rRNA (pseudouridine1915-N3)-methyltransferase|nr:23S rRNA (pseudouridine(1915)-N(3))-methyltransferase RlmH [Dysgonamonadaceae bacterium]